MYEEPGEGGGGSNHNHISHSWAFPQHLHTSAYRTDFQTHVPRASLKTFHQKGRRGSGSGSQNRELGHSLCMINS